MFVVVVMDDILRKVKSDGYGQNKQKSQSRPAQKLLKHLNTRDSIVQVFWAQGL